MNGKTKMAIGIVVVMLLAGIAPGMTTYHVVNKVIQSKAEVKMDADIATTGNDKIEAYQLDHYKRLDEEDYSGMASEQNDAGYHIDVGDKIRKALPIYPGEVRDGAPGRKPGGELSPPSDKEDWYYFSVCNGQTIHITMNPESDYNLALYNPPGEEVAKSENSGNAQETIDWTANMTGKWYMRIYASNDAEGGNYTFDVEIIGQNDANSSGDAGNSFGSALHIQPGTYDGYLDMNDWEDWYSFDVSSGEAIKVSLEVPPKSDCDIHLYNPSGKLVYSAMYYGDDTLEYPADTSGTWRIKIDLWPGWDTSKWPDNYFLYGSGAYTFTLSIGGTAEPPPGPIPQPDITPVAQTFIVNNDANSNKDEYAYIAAIPAANYIENGKRYVSPVIYKGDMTPTHWYGVVDDTTQYLLDDWNTYLGRHGITPIEYTLPDDPVEAAAYVATTKWSSANLAVIAPDGSDFEDDVKTIVDKDVSLNIQTKVTQVPYNSPKIKKMGANQGFPMFVGLKWGMIRVDALGTVASGPDNGAGCLTPRYEAFGPVWWPHGYDGPGNSTGFFYPVTLPGIYFPFVEGGGDWTLQATLIKGDRYTIPVDTTDCSINVTITTNEPTDLIVFLVDPYGNVRKPDLPHWNGGPINPIHIWNGGHWEGIGYEKWRKWVVEPHTTFSVEVNHPDKGRWTAIVVPYQQMSGSIDYHITATIRIYNPKRIDAGLSAANAAVIASLHHAPLLYVKEDSVPEATSNALTQLGVSEIIFVNINKVSSASLPGSVRELNTMQDVIDEIKGNEHSENVITITSFATGRGYFAPAAMLAAYHGSPVLNIGEAPDAYSTLDKAMVWREYSGSWYHGCRSLGHLPAMDEPFNFFKMLKDLIKNQSIPDPGFDLKKRWFTAIHDGIYNMISKYNLDREGKEVYLFVAPRDFDIRDLVCRAMTGNNSYAGQIPMVTPALDADLICRDILYPAIIFANPGRDITTSQLMNFPDGRQWVTNDGEMHRVYSSRELKRTFSSHGRFYEGHCIFENWLERMNNGVCINYYSGHGTGGSGVSFQYRNVAEEFPYAELRHEDLKNFTWWDGWRGYMYDDRQTKTPRWGGFTWYYAEEPNLYDIVHFKYIDQYLENLHSEIEAFMSCTTAAHFGPMIYLEHGSALYYGNAGTGLSPQEDLLDDCWLRDALVYGVPVGEAFSNYVWLHQRDYTTQDPTAMYGRSSMQVTNVQLFFGDPTLIVYSPEWTEPTPVMP